MTEATKAPPKQEVGFGDKDVETSQVDRYKGVKGRVDRIAIVSGSLLRAHFFFHEPSKKMFRVPENPEVLALCKKSIGEPTQGFSMMLFHYATDNDGNFVDETKCQGKMKTWRISEARYEELSSLARQWPLLDQGFAAPQNDLIIRCTEEQFQRMQFTPAPKAHWKTKQSWYDALKAKEAAAKPKLQQTLGRNMEDQEIMTLLGASVPSQTGGTDKVADIDLGDVLE